MGGSAPPSAPKPPPAPTQTRREAQTLLDRELRDQANQGAGSSFTSPFGSPFADSRNRLLGRLGLSDPQDRLDARPDSDFLSPVDDRDFQSLDAQIRSGSDSQTQSNTVRNREMQRSLLELLGEDVNSPTIL